MALLKHIKHLYNRAGFGISYAELKRQSNRSLDKVVDEIFLNAELYALLGDPPDISEWSDMDHLSKAQKEALRKKSRESLKAYNRAWLEKMKSQQAVLREKMTLFWHGHFACLEIIDHLAVRLNNTIRTHALGSFDTLLREVSKQPAMLRFLNNQQNRKEEPNENFAREVMELFTMGIGNYTEQDIKEAARAFTAWKSNLQGEFFLNKRQEDNGVKTFLGKEGNFSGDDILTIILEQPETAEFIVRKIYRYFVNDKVDEKRVAELASEFRSDWQIGNLMRTIFASDWFYDEENVANKIKSPIELIVGINREFDVTYKTGNNHILPQKFLGQILFYPPNVAGWAGGKTWIDSSTLIYRLKLPSIVLNGGVIDQSAKDDMPEEFKAKLDKRLEPMKEKFGRAGNIEKHWTEYVNALPKTISDEELAEYLIAPDVSSRLKKIMAGDNNKRSKILKLLSIPEYQLC